MFDFIYNTAKYSTSFETLKLSLSNSLHDIDSKKPFLNTRFLITPAGQLVLEGENQKVEWLRLLGASVDTIAQAYAYMSQDKNVNQYRTSFNADPTAIAVGYALNPNGVTLANKYVDEHGADVHQVAYALAVGGHDETVETYIAQRGADVNLIAQGYATGYNVHKVIEYIEEYSDKINKDQIAYSYAIAGNHKQVEIYRQFHQVDVNFIACAYAIAGNHEQVERYHLKLQADVNEIAQTYAIAGNHEQVEIWRSNHGANVNAIASAYAFSGNYPGIEHYRTRHNANFNSIAEGFKQNPTMAEKNQKEYLIYLLDSYLTKRASNLDSSQTTKEYLYSRFFIFQKSYTQKQDAVLALKQALNGEAVNLHDHLSTLRNGTLGETLRGFIKSGMGNLIAGREVNTVSDFVLALERANQQNSNQSI